MISIQENSSLKCDNVSAVASITGLQSDIQLENSRFRYEIKNVLWLEGSKLTMSASNAHGGLVMKDKSFYSTVRATNANCHFIRSTISMSETSPALYVIDSQVVVEESVCDALQSEASTLELKQTRIEKFLHIYRSSKLIAESVLIMGYDARKINFFATKNVKIEVSNLVFAYASQPMIRLDKSVAFDVKQVRQLVDSGQGAHFFAATAANDLNYRPEKIVIDYMTVVSPSEKLHKMIGMTSVKRNVEEFVAVAQLNKRREKQGLGTSEMTMHSLFLGNPGTGKTSVARIIGQILFEKGVIEKPKFVETSRSDLVGGYIGQTAIIHGR